ncbi:RrF2 family transcriptional regulator [Fontivita pretiosa]|uniref:RrF2 family transcriptional regulator n=1 Tax=Fontivita pretiosa TaxID=2989684 RepID=UPI003D16454F
MISQSAEYSLRAIVCLAQHAGRPLTIRQIAQVTRVPAGYLAKLLALLHRAGIVASQRGLRGGYTLLKDPASITLLEVVQVADPSRRIAACPLGIAAHANGRLCSLHRRLDSAAAAAEAVLRNCTIADVLGDGTASLAFADGCACANPPGRRADRHEIRPDLASPVCQATQPRRDRAIRFGITRSSNGEPGR